jgi:hypothetical protein
MIYRSCGRHQVKSLIIQQCTDWIGSVKSSSLITYCPMYWTWGRAISPWALHLLEKSQSAEHVCGNNVWQWYTFILLWEVNTCGSQFSQNHLTILLWICTISLFSFSSFSIASPLFTRWGQWSWESKLDLAISLFWSLFFFAKRLCYLQSLKIWVHKISTQCSFSFSSILNNTWE